MKRLFLKETGEATFFLSNVAIAVATLGLAIRSPWGFFTLDSKELLSVAVPVAGTLVALSLVAVQIAQSIMDNFSLATERLLKAKQPVQDVVSFLKKQAVFRRQDVQSTLAAVYFSIVSLVAGLLGEVLPADRFQLAGLASSPKDIASALACTALLTAVAWLILILRLSVKLDEVDKVIALLDKPSKKPSGSPPAGPGHGLQTAASPSPANAHDQVATEGATPTPRAPH
ncbi:hypothetical protein [Dyella choica]|uniref:DUF2721 domain-containing protein n=1 Tax=Dyella choica TaxID=1927959 RepID=A0A3S0SBV1_9GAMM|nr:hypothetical protein [Dyella choica]RUL78387.1 hypothetical protein EKH80_06080 [Dyella choica]